MRDIRYKWNAGHKSVGIANEVQLPQFRVLGHRQRAREINLSTGTISSQTESRDEVSVAHPVTARERACQPYLSPPFLCE
ncbi:unnamed protein product [Nezara viridula]|uniref:Uncharacterized protein n=1 Tax=Nezara viridula TaxID=85310 RepID=A0A9P0DYG8_NEZVI|nr:unnamed protein product [Nezara viridula]